MSAGVEKDPEEPFELLEHLGIGGFAHTWRARVLEEDLIEDFGTDEVALKIPLNRKKERVLRRELEMNSVIYLRLKGLESLNLVRYLGFAVFRGQIVMAMEYVGGGSLRRVLGDIGRQKRLAEDQAVNIAEGVLKGLEIIHGERVFHRDIKPENILIGGETPKIADFGISRMLASNELASTTTGTIYYMSPELLGEEGASFSSDIWSMGVTLYEMLTGQLPFGDNNTPIGTMTDLIRRAEPTHACDVCSGISQALGDILVRALKKRPEDRYSTAEEMRCALEAHRKGSDSQLEHDLAEIRELMYGTEDPCRVEGKIVALAEKHPSEPKVCQALGVFYNRCQRYSQAIDAFKQGLALAANDALLHWDLAFAYLRAGKRSEAADHLRKAQELGLDASQQKYAKALLPTLEGGGR